MKQPTPRQHTAWYEQQPTGPRPCSDCGKVGERAYVQPQHPFYMDGKEGISLCGDCIHKKNTEAREKRKEELDALPRCEVVGCQHRGAWVTYGVLLCGKHLNNVKRNHARNVAQVAGGMGLFMHFDYGREHVLELAKT